MTGSGRRTDRGNRSTWNVARDRRSSPDPSCWDVCAFAVPLNPAVSSTDAPVTPVPGVQNNVYNPSNSD